MMTKTIFAPRDYYSVYKSCNSTHPRPMSRASASDEDEKWGGDGVAMARSMLHLEIDDEFGTSFRSSVTNVKSEDQVIICYPNPASNNLLISRAFDNRVVYQISLMNTIGEIVTIEKFSSKNHLLKLGDLRSGSYLIKITDQNNVICSKTIIKL